jgi:hypothetical protein
MIVGNNEEDTGPERLSVLLERVLGETDGPVTISRLMERTGGRGRYLLIVVLCLPFTTPVPLPGVSSLIGLMIIWLALMGTGPNPARFPAWLGRKTLPAGKLKLVLVGSRRVVSWIEKVSHPRGSNWLATVASRRGHAILMVLLAILLSLPLPIPFTNSAPGYALILLSVCLMERDGRLIFLAYLVSALAILYVVGMLVGGVGLFQWLWAWVLRLVGGWV